MHRTLFLFLFVLLLNSQLCKSQEILRFEHFNTSRGLSQNTVSTILCDSKGFLWLGTNSGLNRFDGTNFRVFVNEEQGVQNFTHNRIIRIWEDAVGFIWFETHDGHYHYFDPVNETFTTLSTFFSEDDISQAFYSDFLQYTNEEIWISTLNRGVFQLIFNRDTHSYTIKSYTSRGLNSITNDCVYFLHKDTEGKLWMGTKRGITYAENTTEDEFGRPFKFEHFFVTHSFVDAIETTAEIWFATAEDGILKYHKGHQLYSYLNKEISKGLISNKIKNIFITKTGTIIVSLENKGIQLYNHRADEWNTIKTTGKNVNNIYEDRFNKLWITTESYGVDFIDLENKSQTHFNFFDSKAGTIPDAERHVFYEDSDDNLWIGTHEGGLNLYKRDSNKFVQFLNNPQKTHSISSNIVHTIIEDHSGQLWVGTGQFQGGLERIVKTEPFIEHIIPVTNNSNLSENIVRAVFEDDKQRVWYATKAGRLHIKNKLNEEVVLENFRTQNGTISGINFYSIFVDKDGYLWLGSKGRGILVSNNKLNDYSDLNRISFTNYLPIENDTTSLSSSNIYSITQDNNGIIWIGTYGQGVNYTTNNTSGKRTFKRIDISNSNLSNNLVRNIFVDSKQRVWIATVNGLNLIENFEANKSIKVRNFFADEKKESLSLNDVVHIFEDSKGVVWFATFSGINKLESLDKTNAKFSHLHQKDGLSNNVVYGILEDKKGFIWFSTENGLSRYNKKNNIFEVFNTNNGLNFDSFSENTCFANADGVLYFGGYYGVEKISPEKIFVNPFTRPVEITDFRLFNKEVKVENNSVLKQGISFSKEIILKDYQNSFSFDYSAMDYMNIEKTQYAYKLAPLDNDWNYVNNQRRASYTNLAPGKYKFKVKAMNRVGQWTDIEKEIAIRILPPWYKTIWAFILYSMIIIFLLYLVYSFLTRINKYRNELVIEKTINEDKLQFFTNISHELRTPLTLIVGPLDDLIDKDELSNKDKDKLELISRNGKRMLHLITQLLDFRKIQNNKMHLRLSQFDIVSFSNMIFQSFKPLADHKNIHYTFESSVDSKIIWGDYSKLDTVIYNLISNALKFTEANKKVTVNVNYSTENDEIKITVKDEGRGIEEKNLDDLFQRYTILSGKDLSGTGIGLSLSNEIIKLHEGEINVKSQVNVGSEFIVTLKCGDLHFKDKNVIWEKDDEAINIKNHHSEQLLDTDFNSNDSDDVSENNNQKPLILIVEDNKEIGEYIASSLKEDFVSILVENGKEALEALQKQTPYLIISDIMMPIMDGLELTQKVRENFDTSHIPIILLTSKSSIEDQIEGMKYGADMYISKPFNSTFLRLSVKNIYNQRTNLVNKFKDNKTINPDTLQINSKDEEFLKKIISYVEENYSEDFSIEVFAEEMFVSRTVFYNKVKSLTGLSPIEFVREIKLKIASQFLAQGYNVSEAALKVGFLDTRYFSRQFKQQFGYLPSKHIKMIEEEKEENNPDGETEEV